MRTFLVLALTFASGAAQASQWAQVGMSNNGKQLTFIDVSSIKISGAIRRAWAKTTFSPHSVRGGGADSKKWITESVSHWDFNCEEETSRSGALVNYYDDGTTHSGSSPGELWAPVPPDTVLSATLEFVCAWKPQ